MSIVVVQDRASFSLLARHEGSSLVAVTRSGHKTAAELRGYAAAVAGALAVSGAEHVVLAARDRYLFAAGLLGAWLHGACVVLAPNLQPQVVRDAISSQPRTLHLHDGEAPTALSIDLRGLSPSAELPAFRPIKLPAQQQLVRLWTSGSTAAASAHCKTARQLLGEAETLARTFGLGPDTRILATAPSFHIYGLLFGLSLPLVCGGTFVSASPLQPAAVAGALRDTEANVLVSVPAHLRAIATLEADELQTLRRIFSSGAPLLSSTASALRTHHDIEVTEVLGSTETGGIAWRVQSSGRERWRSFPGIRVAADAQARLLVASPFLPEGAGETWPTGDRIELADDGTFVHLGRVDGVVKVGGKRVALADVERALVELEGVQDAAVMARAVGGVRDHEIAALIVAGGHSIHRVRRELRCTFDPVLVPRRIRIVEKIPRDSNGKISGLAFWRVVAGLDG
ncbi:MAG: AMP-binding protein [Nannocystaceae bacterium]